MLFLIHNVPKNYTCKIHFQLNSEVLHTKIFSVIVTGGLVVLAPLFVYQGLIHTNRRLDFGRKLKRVVTPDATGGSKIMSWSLSTKSIYVKCLYFETLF